MGGAANAEVMALTAIASLLAGGEHVDDVNALRAGRAGVEILGVRPAAASTVGTFLRAFTSGHARQLDAVQAAKPIKWKYSDPRHHIRTVAWLPFQQLPSGIGDAAESPRTGESGEADSTT